MEATVRLGSVNLQHHRLGHKVMDMIETPTVIAKDGKEIVPTRKQHQYLFTVTYRNVSRKTACFCIPNVLNICCVFQTAHTVLLFQTT